MSVYRISSRVLVDSADAGRIQFIDGMRGIATLFVFFFHISCIFIPALCHLSGSSSVFEKIWINSPLNVITNGNTPVQFFFCASGFLITRKIYLKRADDSAPNARMVFKKYISLLKIVIPAVMLAFLLMESGAMFHLKALALNNKLAAVSGFNNFQPSFLNLLKEMFISPFISTSRYVSPLWTMRYELAGSSITAIMAYCACHVKKNRKWIYDTVNHSGGKRMLETMSFSVWRLCLRRICRQRRRRRFMR